MENYSASFPQSLETFFAIFPQASMENFLPHCGKGAENGQFQRFEGVLGSKMLVFHAMENFSSSFPQYGKLLAIFSTLAMENFLRIFPQYGKLL